MLYACHVNEYLNPLYPWFSGHDLSLIRDMDGDEIELDTWSDSPALLTGTNRDRKEFHIMVNLMRICTSLREKRGGC